MLPLETSPAPAYTSRSRAQSPASGLRPRQSGKLSPTQIHHSAYQSKSSRNSTARTTSTSTKSPSITSLTGTFSLLSRSFIPGGQYKFPFEFHLKDSLPGTFERKGHDFQARIRYKVKADVDSKEKQLDRLKNSQDIIVREPIKEAMNSLEGSQVVHPKTFCCIPQGVPAHLIRPPASSADSIRTPTSLARMRTCSWKSTIPSAT